jgi:DNA-binding PadR family transcriptional regulator
LNATAASLLGVLRRHGELTGAGLVRATLLEIGEFFPLARSQAYRELTDLADHDLVEAGPPGPRSSRPHRVTRAGEVAFLEWLAQTPGEDSVRFPLLLTISFGSDLPPARLAELVDAHEARHREKLARYRALLPQVEEHADAFVAATLHLGIRYQEATLAWFSELPPEVRGRISR